MKKATDNIRNPKIRAYFEETTEGRAHTVKLSADELEEGVNQFDEGLRQAMSEVDEKLFRSRLGEVPEAISFSYIAKKYFGKSRGWLMQKVNGNTVNGKQAVFTEEERRQFRAALQDISKQLSIAALAF
jgi:hypothetical protein